MEEPIYLCRVAGAPDLGQMLYTGQQWSFYENIQHASSIIILYFSENTTNGSSATVCSQFQPNLCRYIGNLGSLDVYSGKNIFNRLNDVGHDSQTKIGCYHFVSDQDNNEVPWIHDLPFSPK